LPRGDLTEAAYVAWSMVHGIAKLGIAGRFHYRSQAQVLRFAEFAIDKLLEPRD
jgi:hypothetical protein